MTNEWVHQALPEYNTTGRDSIFKVSRLPHPTSHHRYPTRQPTSHDRYPTRQPTLRDQYPINQPLARSPLAPSRHSFGPSPLTTNRDGFAMRGQLSVKDLIESSDQVATRGRSSASSEETVRPYLSDTKHQMFNELDARSEVQLPILPGRPDRSRHSTSSASSGFSEARISLASSSTCTSVSGANRESPILPQLQGIRTPEKSTFPDKNLPERQTIPSLFAGDSRTRMPRYPPVQPLNGVVRSNSDTHQPIDRNYNLAPIEYSPDQNYHDRRTRSNEEPYVDYQYSRGDRTRNYPQSFPNSDTGEKNPKRRRGNLPKHVTDRLRQWFFDHISHPYPSEDEKQELMSTTGLNMNQVSR